MRVLRKIIIPKILREVTLSNKRQAKYYDILKIEDSQILKLPKRYQNGEKYAFMPVTVIRNGKKTVIYRLSHKANNQPILKNPIAVGTPKIIKINFQKIWNNEVSDHTRNKIATSMKDSFKEILAHVEPINPNDYPVKTTFNVYTKNELQDVDNLTFLYIKTFHDSLKDEGIILDDKLSYLKRYEAGHEESEEEYIEVLIEAFN